jgi:HSP20 family protein
MVNPASEDNRRSIRDALDELDRYFEEMEDDIQEAVRRGFTQTRGTFGPFMAGFSFELGPEGKPSIQFFGDNPTQTEGYRSPLWEQVVDDKSGTLRLVVDMPGVEKENIEISVAVTKAVIRAEHQDRKYRGEIDLRAEVDPDSGKAEYRNGVLEILFSLRDKTNKGFKKVNIV